MTDLRFSKRLKELRSTKGVTQEELANSINIKRTTLINYENKGTQPDFDTLIKLAEYFEVSIDYLVGRVDTVSKLFINSSFKAVSGNMALRDAIYANQKMALWLRITGINTENLGERHDTYRLQSNAKIELYSPLELSESDAEDYKRIYLAFVNCLCSPSEQAKLKVFQFMLKYGFIGYGMVMNEEHTGENVNIIEHLKNQSQFFADIGYFNKYHSNQNALFEKVLQRYSESVAEVYTECKKLSRVLADLYSQYYFIDDRPDNDEKLYQVYRMDEINNYLKDIVYQQTLVNGEFHTAFGYRSLLSLMYLELLFDIGSGTIPQFCGKCERYFIQVVGEENHICKYTEEGGSG